MPQVRRRSLPEPSLPQSRLSPDQTPHAPPDSSRQLRGRATGAAAALAEFEEEVAMQLRWRGLDRASASEAQRDEIALLEQNGNPVKVATSGLEGPAAQRYFAGGRWRTVERVKWWEREPPPAGRLYVVGHYWRRFMGEVRAGYEDFTPSGPDMFAGYRPEQLLGATKRVMCVDYAVGVRYEERGKALPDGALGTNLGALRLPERELRLADGRVLPVS